MRVSFILILWQCAPAFAAVLMQPYLQALTPTSVCVMVESDSNDTLTVRYGTTEACGLEARTGSIAMTTASPVTFVHCIPLGGLVPETQYFYRVGGEGSFTELARFRTGALPGTPFRFAWIADDRGGPDVFDSVIVHVTAAGPLLAIYGGDLCIRSSYSSWKEGFFREPQLSFGARVPWVNAPGNHELWSTNTMAFTHAPVGSPSDGYFSFDCGDMHVLVLNTQLPLGEGSPQYAFAESDLRGTNRIWRVVALHKPAYCAGGHGEDSAVMAMSGAIFEPAGVDVVLAGHSHFYQHNIVHGIHHMIIGSAGAPLYDPENASYTVKSAKEYNWAYADVSPHALTLYVLNEHGAPLDTLRLRK